MAWNPEGTAALQPASSRTLSAAPRNQVSAPAHVLRTMEKLSVMYFTLNWVGHQKLYREAGLHVYEFMYVYVEVCLSMCM